MNRTDNIRRLASETFDLCIIGGGASGAGCALDAALRGLRVALIDRSDFSAETSSRSTKLVHGGVRYLEQAFKKLDFAQLRQVRHGLRERRTVWQNAPHLAHPLGLVTPVFSWWEGLYFSIGLRLYDWFAGKKSGLPPSRWLSKKEALRRIPGLSPRIHSAVLYYDGQLDDARYGLALVQSAAEAGAVVANYLEVRGFQTDAAGKLKSALLQDRLGADTPFALKATQFLNCCGPYADHIRQLANPEIAPRIRPSKGVHLVLPGDALGGNEALLIPKTRDGRMVFAIPFEGNVLLGTTDEPYARLEAEPVLESTEVDFLLETLQPFLVQKIEKSRVKSGFGGIRPLISPLSGTKAGATKSLLRDHEVELDPRSGLISLLGGKWTTYRLMARDAVDVVCKGAGISAPCSTESRQLVGAAGYKPDLWREIQAAQHLEEDIARRLAMKYGARAWQLLSLLDQNQELRARLLAGFPFIHAEIVYAVRQEMAMTLRDFLARRIRLEFCDWAATQAAVPRVAEVMGKELGWTDAATQQQIAEYLDLLRSFQRHRDGVGLK